MEWRRGDTALTEATATADHPLPAAGRRLAYRFEAERRGRCDVAGVRYHVGLQVEVLPPEVFLHVHEELVEVRVVAEVEAPHDGERRVRSCVAEVDRVGQQGGHVAHEGHLVRGKRIRRCRERHGQREGHDPGE